MWGHSFRNFPVPEILSQFVIALPPRDGAEMAVIWPEMISRKPSIFGATPHEQIG